jgi:hypothetical protein
VINNRPRVTEVRARVRKSEAVAVLRAIICWSSRGRGKLSIEEGKVVGQEAEKGLLVSPGLLRRF